MKTQASFYMTGGRNFTSLSMFDLYQLCTRFNDTDLFYMPPSIKLCMDFFAVLLYG